MRACADELQRHFGAEDRVGERAVRPGLHGEAAGGYGACPQDLEEGVDIRIEVVDRHSVPDRVSKGLACAEQHEREKSEGPTTNEVSLLHGIFPFLCRLRDLRAIDSWLMSLHREWWPELVVHV